MWFTEFIKTQDSNEFHFSLMSWEHTAAALFDGLVKNNTT